MLGMNLPTNCGYCEFTLRTWHLNSYILHREWMKAFVVIGHFRTSDSVLNLYRYENLNGQAWLKFCVSSWLSRAPYWHGLTVVSAWIHIHVPSKYWMKSLIISQTSTVELLKFGKQFHPTLFNRCNCFSVLGSKLFLIKERDPWSTLVTGHLVLFCQVCATHLKIGNPCIKSRVMVSRSPNWLRRLDLTIGQQENSNKNGCQGDMHFWRIQLSVGTVCPT